MITADLINGLFELGASLFIANNCRILYKDKMVRGVSIISTMFFTTWGFWNAFYYPYIGQKWSFYFGLMVCLVNVVWVSMMIYYAKFAGPTFTLEWNFNND